MNISYSWLKEFIPDLPSADEVAKLLPMHGLEVESVIDQSRGLESIVVGEVLTVEKHPQADRLNLTTVNIGNDRELAIVCGAPNVRVGMKVPVAVVGTTLPNSMTIERRAIRGHQSEGMLCAEDELGLGTGHDGLLELPADSRPGQSFVEVLGLDDCILDLSIPSNRADLLSVRGLAREIGAVLGFSVRWPNEPGSKEKLGKSSWKPLIDAGSGVTQLHLQSIKNISSAPTPTYIVRRLRSAGIRSVNAVVDITNYVMLEYGQPLHAYDAETLHGKELHGRRLKAVVPFTTLDGASRELPAETMVITDEDRVVAAGGIMGGQDTEVTATTNHILLEAAIFDGPTIRRSARSMGLMTEAVKRFERGIWPSLPITALEAARALIVAVCGGALDGDIQSATPIKEATTTIRFDHQSIQERIGLEKPVSEIRTALERFGYEVKGKNLSTLNVPDWRLDVRIAEDILDDIGRVIGYEEVPQEFPPNVGIPEGLADSVRVKDELRQALKEIGATEIILHATYGQSAVEQVGGAHILVANPLDQTQHALRASLIPGIERVLTAEVDAGRDASIFEIGRVFQNDGGVDDQPWYVGIGFALKVPNGSTIDWEVNGRLTAVATRLRRSLPAWTPRVQLVKGRTIVSLEVPVAAFGPIQQVVLGAQGMAPSVERDVTVEVPMGIQYNHLRQAISSLRLSLLKTFYPVSIFTTEEKRNITLRCMFQDVERTLTSEEVDVMMQKITTAIPK